MDSNQRPPDYKSGALPTELRQQKIRLYIYFCIFKDTSPEVTFCLRLSTSKFNEPSSLTSRAVQSDDEKFDTRTFLFFNILRLSKSFLNALKPFSRK